MQLQATEPASLSILSSEKHLSMTDLMTWAGAASLNRLHFLYLKLNFSWLNLLNTSFCASLSIWLLSVPFLMAPHYTVKLWSINQTAQVSHHPPVSALHVEHPEWTYYHDFSMTSKFRGKYLQVFPIGVSHFIVKGTGHHYTWNKVHHFWLDLWVSLFHMYNKCSTNISHFCALMQWVLPQLRIK